MFNSNITCIVCNKKVAKGLAIKKHGETFCSTNCLTTYEEELKKIGDNMHLDDCC